MKRIFSCSKKKVSKPYNAVEIARLMVYMARPQKVYIDVRKHYVEFNEENPWASKWRYIDIDAYPVEVIKTIDDVIDMVKVHGIPYWVGGFIPTNETVLTPYTIARLLYTL